MGKRSIKVGKRPIKEGKRPINANGQFPDTPPWWKTAPLKRPIKRSMSNLVQLVKISDQRISCTHFEKKQEAVTVMISNFEEP